MIGVNVVRVKGSGAKLRSGLGSVSLTPIDTILLGQRTQQWSTFVPSDAVVIALTQDELRQVALAVHLALAGLGGRSADGYGLTRATLEKVMGKLLAHEP